MFVLIFIDNAAPAPLLMKLLFPVSFGDFTENHGWAECREKVTVACSVPNGTSIRQNLYLRLREHHGRGAKRITRAGEPGGLL